MNLAILPERRAASDLAAYKRPTSITVVDAIPKDPVGKADEAPLRAARAAEASERSGEQATS